MDCLKIDVASNCFRGFLSGIQFSGPARWAAGHPIERHRHSIRARDAHHRRPGVVRQSHRRRKVSGLCRTIRSIIVWFSSLSNVFAELASTEWKFPVKLGFTIAIVWCLAIIISSVSTAQKLPVSGKSFHPNIIKDFGIASKFLSRFFWVQRNVPELRQGRSHGGPADANKRSFLPSTTAGAEFRQGFEVRVTGSTPRHDTFFFFFFS